MTDNFENAMSKMCDYANKTDALNYRLILLCKWLIIGIIALAVSFSAAITVTICYKDYAYFFSDYMYPEVSQEVSDDIVKQNINMNGDD